MLQPPAQVRVEALVLLSLKAPIARSEVECPFKHMLCVKHTAAWIPVCV